MPKRTSVGVTGTREGMTTRQERQFRKMLRGFYGYFHFGDAIGVDVQAADIADQIGGFVIYSHPPVNPRWRAKYKPKHSTFVRYRPKDYGKRDLDIVLESSIMIACPKETSEPRNKRGSGTWLTIGFARKYNKPLIIIWADGKISEERTEG